MIHVSWVFFHKPFKTWVWGDCTADCKPPRSIAELAELKESILKLIKRRDDLQPLETVGVTIVAWNSMDA